jgi:O-antigen/teichoic acid export membrane protein
MDANPDVSSPATVRDAPAGDVERLLKVGAMWTVGAQIALQVTRILTVVILARILTPDEYGTAALAVMIASYAAILGDLGYGGALVQAREASRRSISTAFWCGATSGALMFVVAALLAYPAGLVLGEPEVAGLIVASGSTLLVFGLGSTSGALLTRSLNFRALQLIALSSALLASVCAIVGAIAGAGPWALVLQQVVLGTTAAALLVAVARWTPSPSFSAAAFKRLTRFAVPYTASAIFFVAYHLVAALLVGWLVGIEELGLWTMATTIVVLPATLLTAPVAKVVFAAFSRMPDTTRKAEVWLTGTQLLASLLLPTLFALAALAPDLVPLVLGDRWDDAVPIVQVLCISAILGSLVAWGSSVLDAAGRPYVTMAVNATIFVVLPLGIAAGSRFGIEGVAASYVVVIFCFAIVPMFVLVLRELSLSTRLVLARAGRIMAAALVMFATILLVRAVLSDWGVDVVLRVFVSSVVGAIVYLGSLMFFSPAIARRLLRLPLDVRRQRR